MYKFTNARTGDVSSALHDFPESYTRYSPPYPQNPRRKALQRPLPPLPSPPPPPSPPLPTQPQQQSQPGTLTPAPEFNLLGYPITLPQLPPTSPMRQTPPPANTVNIKHPTTWTTPQPASLVLPTAAPSATGLANAKTTSKSLTESHPTSTRATTDTSELNAAWFPSKADADWRASSAPATSSDPC